MAGTDGKDLKSAEWGLACLGAVELLDEKKAVVLNSSQGKYPTIADPWMKGTLRGLDDIAEKDEVSLTSVGLNTWEFACWASGRKGLRQIVAAPFHTNEPAENRCRRILRDFDLDVRRTCFLMIPAKRGKPKSFWQDRDTLIVELADRILPVSIRPKGRMDSLLSSRKSLREKADPTHRVRDFVPKKQPGGWAFRIEAIENEVDPRFRNHLFHWTRASAGPWPGEKPADYYRDIVEGGSRYVRTAAKTLERIVREKRLRASGWRIRGGVPVVSFTSLSPSRSTGLMRWRKRYGRFTIEPYGIAIGKDAAERMGTLPVVYVERGEVTEGQPVVLQQGKGEKGFWPAEREYRHRGDLDLSVLPEGSWETLDLTPYVRNA